MLLAGCDVVAFASHTDPLQAASLGVDAHLIRFSVGLEDTQDLVDRFQQALAVITKVID